MARLKKGIAYKQEGNRAYLAKEYVAALRAYHYATLHLSGLDESVLHQFKQPQTDETAREDQRQLSLVRSNRRFDRAVEACDQALASDPTNAKAIFRKAQALRQRGDIYQAHEWLNARAAKPYAHGADFDAERSRIASCIAARERASRSRLRGFLSST